MLLFRENVLGQKIFLKRLVIRLFGTFVWIRFNINNRSEIQGSELFQKLRDKNVLIISNHQTYFADVSFFYLTIYSALKGFTDNMKFPGYLFCRKSNLYYVAAEETMKSGIIPKMLILTGAVTINRNWRADGKNVRRKVDRAEVENIDKAMKDGWVITFPQGTTTPYSKGRVGTAFLVKKHKPIVVPVVIDGFRRAFDKTGIATRKKRSTLKMIVKQPLDIDYDASIEEIMEQMMGSIEQSSDHDVIEKIKKHESISD
jgi:1-acyl-sn-glycerol-3-phosphate acyltransferase